MRWSNRSYRYEIYAVQRIIARYLIRTTGNFACEREQIDRDHHDRRPEGVTAAATGRVDDFYFFFFF